MVGRLRWYRVVVAAIGLAVLYLFAANVDLDRLRGDLPETLLLTLFVLGGPFLTIPLSGDDRGPSIHLDTPFVFALALVAGPGVAAVLMAASIALYHLLHRRPLDKLAFNNGTHMIGLAPGPPSGRPWPLARSATARPCRRS